MKTFLSIVLLLIAPIIVFAPPTSSLPSVTLAWDQSPDPTVSGYNLYWGTQARTNSVSFYTNSVPVPGVSNTSCTISNLVRGTTYYFAATCVATNGLESLYSAEVSYRTLSLPPAPLNLTVRSFTP